VKHSIPETPDLPMQHVEKVALLIAYKTQTHVYLT